MCVPAAGIIGGITSAISIATSVGETITNTRQSSINGTYRTQLAINNAKSAKNEAQRQEQLGINESRKEQIQGIKKVKELASENASNGFDMNSESNLYAYDDIYDEYKMSADEIKNSYNAKAQNYYEKANSFLDSANVNISSNNTNLINQGMNFLNDFSSVATNWYQGGSNGNFKSTNI